jgi:hypothetical protein
MVGGTNEPLCQDGALCGRQSAIPDRICLNPWIPAETSGQGFVSVRVEAAPCTAEALPCEARLLDGKLRADPFLGLRDGLRDCAAETRPVEIWCTAPALPPGTFPVVVNNIEAGLLVVGGPAIPSPSHCFTTRQPGEPLTCERRTSEQRPSCLPSEAPADEWISIPVVEPCTDCFARPGPCEVRVNGRLLELTPSLYRCDCPVCGACADVCYRREMTCEIPPLPPGTYNLQLPGLPIGTLLYPVTVRRGAALRCR